MTTRRARIKAVATLPIRRKQNTSNEGVVIENFSVKTTQNNGTNDESGAQQSQNTNQSPRSIQSPQTHRSASPQDIPKTQLVMRNNPQASPKTPYSEKDNFKSNDGSSKRKQPTPTKICKVENQMDHKTNDIKDELANNLLSPEVAKTQVAVRRRIMRPAINIPASKRMKLQNNSKSIDNTKHDHLHKQNMDDEKSKSTASTPPMMSRFSPKTDSAKTNKIIPIDKADAAKFQEVDLTDIDGIVPLQSKSVVEDSDAVKKDIISDVATVNFDPIIPLHSPSKVRPKLRPAPRLAGRRSSYQGSASESDDDSRKSAPTPKPINERRKSASASSSDYSVSKKNVDDIRTQTESQSTTAMSPVRQTANSSAQPKRSQSSKPRGTGIRRILRNPTGNKDNLTMYDLIFFNPTTNPIVPDEDEVTLTKKELAQMKMDSSMESENVDNPSPVSNEKDGPGDKEEEPTAMPVPQIKLGPNGEIILDEKSLVIETTESKTRHLSGSIVRETGGWGANGAGRYTRSARAKDWADDETVRFYRALATIGTDFSLMMALFPGRSRRDLKVKFKKEERNNGHLVDKAMYNPMEFNMTQLMEDFKEEERRKVEEQRERERMLRENKEQILEERNRLKELTKNHRGKIDPSQFGIINTILPTNKGGYSKTQMIRTADEIVEQGLEAKRKVRVSRKKASLKNKDLERQGSQKIPITNNLQQQELDEASSKQVRPNESKRIYKKRVGKSDEILPVLQERPQTDGPALNEVSCHQIRPNNELQQMSNKRIRKSSEVPSVLQERPQADVLQQIPKQKTPRRSPATIVPPVFSATSVIPKNVEIGSLVVLTTEVPGHESQKMLQTYITGADGKLTPIALPTSLLGSVMKYVRHEKDNKPDHVLDLSNVRSVSGGATLTPHIRQLHTPNIATGDEANSSTASTSGKRTRHNSYSITSL